MDTTKTTDKHFQRLKITDIKIFRFDIPLRDVFQIATMSLTSASNVLIKIETNEGVIGWGEAAPFHALVGETQGIDLAVAQELKQFLLGKNPMEFVSQHTRIPIMADESLFSPHDALALVDRDVTPYFNIKLSKSGGIRNAMMMSHIAEAGDIPCMLGCMSETKLGITAAAHVALSSHAFKYFDLDSHLEHAENRIQGGIEITGGIITLPDEPGIGAYPEPDYVAQLEEMA